MPSELSFESLRRIQLEEKRSPGLTRLEPEFYGACRAWMGQQQGRLHQEFSLEGASVYESCRKVLKDVWERRQQKIAAKAISDARSGRRDPDGLSAEEQRLYNALLTLFSDSDALSVSSAPTPSLAPSVAQPTPGQPPAEPDATGTDRVRFNADVPAFVAPDGRTLGPFKAGEEAVLPTAVASVLQRRNAATRASPALASDPTVQHA